MKSKTTAGLLAIFLGGLGAHKFYLGKFGVGVIYLLTCWTFVPMIIGLIEGIAYLATPEASWNRTWNPYERVGGIPGEKPTEHPAWAQGVAYAIIGVVAIWAIVKILE